MGGQIYPKEESTMIEKLREPEFGPAESCIKYSKGASEADIINKINETIDVVNALIEGDWQEINPITTEVIRKMRSNLHNAQGNNICRYKSCKKIHYTNQACCSGSCRQKRIDECPMHSYISPTHLICINCGFRRSL